MSKCCKDGQLAQRDACFQQILMYFAKQKRAVYGNANTHSRRTTTKEQNDYVYTAGYGGWYRHRVFCESVSGGQAEGNGGECAATFLATGRYIFAASEDDYSPAGVQYSGGGRCQAGQCAVGGTDRWENVAVVYLLFVYQSDAGYGIGQFFQAGVGYALAIAGGQQQCSGSCSAITKGLYQSYIPYQHYRCYGQKRDSTSGSVFVVLWRSYCCCGRKGGYCSDISGLGSAHYTKGNSLHNELCSTGCAGSYGCGDRQARAGYTQHLLTVYGRILPGFAASGIDFASGGVAVCG